MAAYTVLMNSALTDIHALKATADPTVDGNWDEIAVQSRTEATAAVPPQCDLTLTGSEEHRTIWFAIRGTPVPFTQLSDGHFSQRNYYVGPFQA